MTAINTFFGTDGNRLATGSGRGDDSRLVGLVTSSTTVCISRFRFGAMARGIRKRMILIRPCGRESTMSSAFAERSCETNSKHDQCPKLAQRLLSKMFRQNWSGKISAPTTQESSPSFLAASSHVDRNHGKPQTDVFPASGLRPQSVAPSTVTSCHHLPKLSFSDRAPRRSRLRS